MNTPSLATFEPSAVGKPEQIDRPFPLSQEQIAQFRKDGFIKLKNVFTPDTLQHYRDEITSLVKSLNNNQTPLEHRNTYSKAFLQVINLWTHSERVKEFVFSVRLAGIARDLLGTHGVRLYHDQALYKEAGGGYTPWHVDQVYWPLASELTVTTWVPLHAVPFGNGPLAFARGSHRILDNRHLTIGDESEKRISEAMKLSNCEIDESPYEPGEVSFHLGYLFHRAGPNTLAYPREVMTVIYMDSEMKLAEPRSEAQKRDWNAWCPGAQIGQVIDTPLNPRVV